MGDSRPHTGRAQERAARIDRSGSNQATTITLRTEDHAHSRTRDILQRFLHRQQGHTQECEEPQARSPQAPNSQTEYSAQNKWNSCRNHGCDPHQAIVRDRPVPQQAADPKMAFGRGDSERRSDGLLPFLQAEGKNHPVLRN